LSGNLLIAIWCFAQDNKLNYELLHLELTTYINGMTFKWYGAVHFLQNVFCMLKLFMCTKPFNVRISKMIVNIITNQDTKFGSTNIAVCGFKIGLLTGQLRYVV
jgi:hypothetical protein